MDGCIFLTPCWFQETQNKLKPVHRTFFFFIIKDGCCTIVLPQKKPFQEITESPISPRHSCPRWVSVNFWPQLRRLKSVREWPFHTVIMSRFMCICELSLQKDNHHSCVCHALDTNITVYYFYSDEMHLEHHFAQCGTPIISPCLEFMMKSQQMWIFKTRFAQNWD